VRNISKLNKKMLNKTLIAIGVLGLILLSGYYVNKKSIDKKHRLELETQALPILDTRNQIQTGDIIFQTSLSEQSEAIQLATKSKYSHCGIIYKKGDAYQVFEAVQPVKYTPLDEWINRGKNGEYVIKRLINADSILTPDNLNKMKQVEKAFKGKPYDMTFEWTDDKIYCSELIWKIYKRGAGIEICKLERLRDFDLTNKKFKIKMTERYKDKIPLDALVVSPKSLFESTLFRTIKTSAKY
jgi:hypothetical protein